MSTVRFNFNNNITPIQCNSNSKIEEIIKKFLGKVGLSKSDVVFLCEGSYISEANEKLTFEEMAKQKNQLNILVTEINSEDKEQLKDIRKSTEIICPTCSEITRINIKDYKISLFECKNGHKLEDILLKEFENTQNIDLAKIICEECKQYNKSKTHENKFFKCMNCKKNICPLCKSTHNKEHKILNYEDINYKCDLHFENYNSYCEDCKRNLCTLCEREHKRVNFGDIL